MLHSIDKGLRRDPPSISYVTDAEECLWRQVFGPELRYVFIKDSLLWVLTLSFAPFIDLPLALFRQSQNDKASMVSFEVALDLDDFRDCVFDAQKILL